MVVCAIASPSAVSLRPRLCMIWMKGTPSATGGTILATSAPMMKTRPGSVP